MDETAAQLMAMVLSPHKDKEIQNAINLAMAMSPEQILTMKCQAMNEAEPSHTRKISDFISCYGCEICKNKMKIYYPLDGEVVFKDCKCIPIRSSILRAKNSGLGEMLAECKFSTFNVESAWQRDIKSKAAAFVENPTGWLYMCGQNGCGKTHLCTAVVGRLIHKGMSARYMLWKDDGVKLISKVNDSEYQDLLKPFLSADVLYIDDFLKTDRGEDSKATRPTTGYLNLAFQIINNRYCGKKTTIISSEHTIDELISYDEATGSRIYEMSKQNCIMIPWDIENNYRMKG